MLIPKRRRRGRRIRFATKASLLMDLRQARLQVTLHSTLVALAKIERSKAAARVSYLERERQRLGK